MIQNRKRGDTIAKIGSTGNSTGPHCHFEVRKDGAYVDPIPWLNGTI
ncbi:MAG: M23 family metallopeptidase [Gudongella sp.]|jgi:murein DD-endopeptidase MepM/ murein hydrolase activator NlpD|nr:M23 family metallopeptidase [Gudongella sp.]